MENLPITLQAVLLSAVLHSLFQTTAWLNGTIRGIYRKKKNLCISVPVQFTPLLFKGQLYFGARYIEDDNLNGYVE